LEAVITEFQLNELEVLRLHTALLVTAIQIMLMNRISKYDAFLAAQQIFSPLQKALYKSRQQGSTVGLGAIRGDEGHPGEENESEKGFEKALEAFDIAMIALHLGNNGPTQTIYRQQARTCFENALLEFNRAEEAVRATEILASLA
jgi:hypothetical protein